MDSHHNHELCHKPLESGFVQHMVKSVHEILQLSIDHNPEFSTVGDLHGAQTLLHMLCCCAVTCSE